MIRLIRNSSQRTTGPPVILPSKLGTMEPAVPGRHGLPEPPWLGFRANGRAARSPLVGNPALFPAAPPHTSIDFPRHHPYPAAT